MGMTTLLDVPEVAAALRVSESMVRKLLAAGAIPKIKVGDRVLVARKDLARFIRDRRKPAHGRGAVSEKGEGKRT